MSEKELRDAAEYNNVDKINTLVGARVDIDGKDEMEGLTALHQAAMKGHTESIECLVRHKAQMDIQDDYGYTALCRAAECEQTESIECLARHKAQMDIQNDNCFHTALHIAAEYGHTENIECLVRHKAQMDIQNEDGWTALHYAAMCGFTKIVECLVRHKAQMDIQSEDGWTALHFVADRAMKCQEDGEYGEVAVVLMANGANRDIKNKEGQTAEELARVQGWER